MGNMQLKSESGRTSTSALAIGLAIGLVAVSLPHLALASSASSGGGLPYESFLKNVTSSISGPVAYAIALILGGDLNGLLRALILLVCFTALLISAPALLTAISGAGAVVALAPAILDQMA